MEIKERLSPIEIDDDRELVEMTSLIREKKNGKKEIRIGLRYADGGGLIPIKGWENCLVLDSSRQKPLTFARPIAVWHRVKIYGDLFKLVWPELPKEEEGISLEQLPLIKTKR